MPATFEPIPGDSDLAQLQALLREDPQSPTPATSHRLQGDGSLILLRAETSRELADATAALLSAWQEPSTAIIRSGEKRPLDDALVAHGLASQGLDSMSEWRPALQVLPLAVELAFEPRDPYRVLELLTLPVGPFQGLVGGKLASALAEAPGIGGPAWQDAKKEIAELTRAKILRESAYSGVALDAAEGLADERVEAQRETIATWLELPGLEATRPAPRASLLAVADRVRTWLQRRLAVVKKSALADPTNPALAEHTDILGTAYARAQEFHATLSHESRAGLDLVDARLLLEQVSSGHTLVLSTDQRQAASIRSTRRRRFAARATSSCGGTARAAPSGVLPCGPGARASSPRCRRRGSCCPVPRSASRPRRRAGITRSTRRESGSCSPSLAGRSARRSSRTPCGTSSPLASARRARTWRASRSTRTISSRAGCMRWVRAAPPVVRDLGPLALPEARPEWRLDPAYLGAAVRHSATSLDALVGCPLQWVFKYPAHIQPGALDSISSGPQLCGKLGHRLVEELHGAGVLANPAALGKAVASSLDRLLREEAAVFLLPGATFELAQLRDQLGRAVTSLAELLTESKLTVVGVEVVVEAPWRAGVLGGRLDLLLRDEAGRDVVLDLKWGLSRYRDLLGAAARRSSRSMRPLACTRRRRRRCPPRRTSPSSEGSSSRRPAGPFVRGRRRSTGPPSPRRGLASSGRPTASSARSSRGAFRSPACGARSRCSRGWA